jgi:hypothetical protein
MAGLLAMNRSFGKKAVLVFWALGFCGAVLFSCGLIFVMIEAKEGGGDDVLAGLAAVGIYCAWECFKRFKARLNSN